MQKLPFFKNFLGNYGLKKKLPKQEFWRLKLTIFFQDIRRLCMPKKKKIKIMSAKANTGQILKISSKQKLDFASTL